MSKKKQKRSHTERVTHLYWSMLEWVKETFTDEKVNK